MPDGGQADYSVRARRMVAARFMKARVWAFDAASVFGGVCAFAAFRVTCDVGPDEVRPWVGFLEP